MPSIGRLFFDIGGDTSRLNVDLKKSLDMVQAAGRDVTASMRGFLAGFQDALNPTQFLTEKLLLLKDAGKSATEVWSVMGKEFQTAYDKAKSSGQPVSDQVTDLIGKFGDLGNKSKLSLEGLGEGIKGFVENPLGSAKNAAVGFLDTLGPTGTGIAAIGGAALLAGKEIFEMAEGVVKAAHNIKNMATETGLSTNEFQSLSKASEMMGISSETIIKGINKLNIELGDLKGGKFTEGLVSLGIALEDAGGHTRKPLDLLTDFREKLLAIPDASTRTETALSILGRRNADLAQILLNTSESVFEFAKHIEEVGAIYSPEALEKADRYAKKVHNVELVWDSFGIWVKENSVSIADSIVSIFTRGDKAANDALDALKNYQDEWSKFHPEKMLPSPQMGELKGAADILFGPEAQEDANKITKATQESTAALREQFKERVKMIEQGKQDIDVRLKIIEAESQLQHAIKVGTDAQAVAIAKTIAGLNEQIKADETYRGEVKSLSDEYRKGTTPADEFARKLKLIADNGLDANAFIKAHADNILKAAAAQREATGSIGKLDIAVVEEALSQSKLGDEYIKTGTAMNLALSQYPDLNALIVEHARVVLDASVAVAELNMTAKAQNDLQKEANALKWGSEKWFAEATPKPIDWKGYGVTPEITKQQKQATDEIGKIWKHLSGQIVDDMARGFADLLTSGKSFAEVFKGIFKHLADDIVQLLVKIMFQPIEAWLIKTLVGMSTVASAAGATGGGAAGAAGGALSGASWTTAAGAGAILGGGILGYTGLKTPGATGWAESMGGGAAIGAGIGLLLGGPLGAAAGALAGAFWGALTKGIVSAFGKSTELAGVMEAFRDFGVNISQSAFKTFYEGVGLTESSAWGIRKDIMSSPKFLAEHANEIDVNKLKAVATSWGTFDFSQAFEVGKATGDWTELNKQFVDAFEHSNALQQNLPNWKEVLAAPAKEASDAASEAVNSLTEQFQKLYAEYEKTGTVSREFAQFLTANGGDLRAFTAALKIPELQQMQSDFQSLANTLQGDIKKGLAGAIEQFTKTGEITDELRQKVTDCGGDIGKFEDYAKIKATQESFKTLRAEFEKTGVVTQDLRDIFRQFGVSIEPLEQLAQVKGLKEFNTELDSLKQTLQSVVGPAKDTIKYFMQTGIVTAELAAKIKAAGGDIGAFTEYARLKAIQSEFATLRSEFEQTGIATDRLREMFREFGVDISALDAAKAIPGLQKFQSSLASIKSTLEGIAGPAKDTLEYFMKTGEIGPGLLQQILAAGGNPEDFQKFYQAGQAKTNVQGWLDETRKSGYMSQEFQLWLREHGLELGGTVGGRQITGPLNPATVSDADWQAIVDKVMGAANQDYIDSATTLLDTVNKMSENVGGKITDLQTAATTALNLLQKTIDEKLAKSAADLLITVDAMQAFNTDKITKLETAAQASLDLLSGKLDISVSEAAGRLQNELVNIDKTLNETISGLLERLNSAIATFINPSASVIEPSTGRTGGTGTNIIAFPTRAASVAAPQQTSQSTININVTFQSANRNEAAKFANETLIPVIIQAMENNSGDSKVRMNKALGR